MTVRSELRITADDVLAGRGRGHEDPQALWRTLVDLGWPLVGVREEVGGSGGSIDDLLELATAIGYATAPVPFAGAAVGGWVAAESGQTTLVAGPPVVGPLHRTDRVDIVAGRATGELRGLPTTGTDERNLIIVPASDAQQPSLVDLKDPSTHVVRRLTLAGETRLDVTLDSTPAQALPTAPPQSVIRGRATLLTLALSIGAMDRALELTIAHVRVREQFGRPLARLPMVMAEVASMAIAATAAHSAMNVARTGGPRETWAAAVVVRRSADDVAASAHQLLGALGTTLEHDLHRATSRIWAWRDDAVTARQAAELLGDLVVSGSHSLWRLATD